MSTSGGEPRTLLNALRPMLGSFGDIKTPQEVVRVISLMRDAEKLMSRCIYLNILKATISVAKENETSSETLEKFMTIGGWSILNKWLVEAKKNENFPVLVELLEVLRDLPVNIDTLKQGNTGKIIKHLTKLENQDVKKLASVIVKQWMSLVRNQSEKVDKPKQNGSTESEDSLQGNRQGDGKSGKRIRDNSSSDSNRSPQPEKKLKTLSEVKSDVKQSLAQKNISKTKVIPPQPKPVAMESAGFMNALTSAASAAPVVRKRKRVTAAKTGTTTTTTVTSSVSNTKPTYTGILDAILDSQSQTHGQEDGRDKESKDKDTDNSNTSNNKSGSTPNGSPENTPSVPSGDIGDFSKGSESSEKDNSPNSASQTSSDTTASAVDEAAAEEKPAKKSKKGKKVQWPTDDANLAIFHFFEMDEDERALVRHPVNFLDAAHNEMVRERQLVEQAKRLSEDIMAERIKWYRPVILTVDHQTERGSKSEQKHIQKTREASILADIFLTKSSLPDSPAEPDPENQQGSSEEPKVIPHDEKGTTHVPAKTPAVSTSSGGGGVQLPAALMSLLSSASSSNTGAAVSQSNSAPVTVQTLLDKLMKPSQPGSISSAPSNSQPQLHNEAGGATLPNALKQILEPLQQNKMGPPRMQGPAMGPGMGAGLLGAAPGDPSGMLNTFRPPGPMGPRGVQGPHLRPDMAPHFQGPGGPRQGPPIGPLFPGPEGPMMGVRMRGLMPPRMQGGHGVGRGPRPLLPEMANRDEFPPDQFDDGGEYGDEDEEGELGDMSMRGRGRGMLRGRGRGRARGRGTPPLCRHFISKRGCLRGATCHFLHPGINGPPV